MRDPVKHEEELGQQEAGTKRNLPPRMQQEFAYMRKSSKKYDGKDGLYASLTDLVVT